MLYKQNPSKKYEFLLIGLALAIIFAMPINGFELKIYGKVNFQPNLMMFNEIPFKYYDNLKVISWFDRCQPYTAKRQVIADYQGGIIRMYCNAEKNDLIHELAHHQQWLHHELLNHNGNFSKYKMEITNASN